jgi:endonuclease G
MSATTGKVALVRNSTSLSGGGCPLGIDPDVVDFVGYGTTANCHEGNANAPAPSNTTAILRKLDGARDTDQNGNDFLSGVPNPRRTAPIVELGPWVAGTDPGIDDTTIPYDASVAVNFSESVTVDSGWYTITCSNTGSHTGDATEAHTSDLKTYAITPNASFQFGEQCTVTIFKTAVHDQDLDDSDPDTDTLLDDYIWSFTVVGAGQAAPYPPSVHLTMGNPSNAVADINQPLNYLMTKPTYAVSYNRDKGTPNWVSWHLDLSWYGTLTRVDTFRPDPAVPSDWYRVQAFDYAGTGFDRGHMTPNADRDNQNRIPINQETYLMTNMVPQAPNNNQGPWADLEAYLRTLTDTGNEIYIIAGPNGVGGVGSASGNTITTIANGHVTVPSSTWKVALVLPQAGGDDVSRVGCSTRTIAVLMPNMQGLNSNWLNHLTTVDAIEQLTGYDLFSSLPPAVQACVEAGTNGTNPPGTADQSANTTEDNPVIVTLQALQANNNTLTFSIVNGPASGSLGSVSPASCASGTCTATVTYTPAADFNGLDNFTFQASDGSLNSNMSTVSVTVSGVQDAPDAVDDTATVAEDSGANTIDVRGNDVDVDNDTLTVTGVTQGAHGSVAITNGGTTVSYTPSANYFGGDSFTYTVDDGNGGSDTATVNVTVNNVNDAPVATGESYVTNSNTTLNVAAPGVLGNDTDIDSATLTAQLVSNVSHGSLTLNANGSFSYAPSPNFEGMDSFTYHADDGSASSNDVTVNITVNDTVAPDLTSSVAISLLTETNSNMVNVGLNASATDNSGDPVTIQVAVFGDEDDQTPTRNNVLHSPDAKDIAPGDLRLRGERVEANDGRVYLIVVTATDSSNNITRNYHTVVVPKSNKQTNIDSVNAQAAAAVFYASNNNGAPPPGYFIIGDGPIIGPKQ